MVADEDTEVGRRLEALLDPGVASTPDLAVVEIRLRRVDRDNRYPADAGNRVAVAEELLEVDVADVAGVVVAGDDNDGLALDLVEVVLGEGVLLLEAERRQVAGADDDVRLQVVDLRDRPLEEVGQKELRAAVQIGDLDDRERVSIRDARSLGPSGLVATLTEGDTGNA